MRYMVLTAVVALMVCGGTATRAQQGSDAYSTMSPEGLRTGVIVGGNSAAKNNRSGSAFVPSETFFEHCMTGRLPAPIRPEPRSVLSHDRVGLDHDRSVQQRRHKAIKPDKEQSVRCREP
jgi:hypothetical protein